jgi:hypothetical protein
MENKISIPKPDQIFDEKDSHNQRKISYNTLYNYLFKKSELTLGNFGIILSVSQSHTEIKLFKGLIEFIEQKYPSNSKNILDLINDTTKKDFYKKAELSVTLSQLRNYSAHPKDLISNDVDAILSKEQYVKVKEFLFLPENQLLVQLLKRPE